MRYFTVMSRVCDAFDFPGGKNTVGAAIDEQGQHRVGRVLLAACAPVVYLKDCIGRRLTASITTWTRSSHGTQSSRSGGISIGVSLSI